jgi:single-stranded-DNA-specific exonuclease
LESCLDLVALGTVADVMPLQMENRYLVASGLRQLGQGSRVGVQALKRVAGVEGKPVGVGTINFVLAPRLNAAGRLGDAGPAVELLTTRDAAEAGRLAEHHQRENDARRAIEETVLREALAQAASLYASGYASGHASGHAGGTAAIVVAARGWHPGVIGIVAARLVERYYRPAVVIAVDPSTGVGKGSGRTIAGIDLYAALGQCAPWLIQFGGHRMAAGLTIQAERIDEFRAAFAGAVAGQAGPDAFTPSVTIDAEVALNECTWSLFEAIGRLAPFGAGNPEPVFVARGVAPSDPRLFGKGHLRMTLRAAADDPAGNGAVRAAALPAVAFGQGNRLRELGAAGGGASPVLIDVVFTLREDRWQGERRLQLQVKDFSLTPSTAGPPPAALAAGAIDAATP